MFLFLLRFLSKTHGKVTRTTNLRGENASPLAHSETLKKGKKKGRAKGRACFASNACLCTLEHSKRGDVFVAKI